MLKIRPRAKKQFLSFTQREGALVDFLIKNYVQCVTDLKTLHKSDVKDKRTRMKISESRIFTYEYTAQVIGVSLSYDPYDSDDIYVDLTPETVKDLRTSKPKDDELEGFWSK